MERSRQQIVEATLRKIIKRPDFPIFAEHLSQIMEIVEDDEASLRHITNAILKDFGLTMKVLRTANSPYYNRSGKSIVTVTHAVALLGLEAIRDLAGSLLLFQHFRAKSAGLRELMMLSLISASHCRATAKRVEYPRIEEAYLCGMFRNLGEVLVAGYLPRKYASILSRMKELAVSEHAACLKVLECSYEDLGRAAARFWKMPVRVRHCMRAEQPRLTKTMQGELDILQALTSFGHELTEAIHRCEPQARPGRLSYLLMTHAPVLALRRRDLQEIAAEAIEETKTTFELLKVPLDDLRLRNQAANALREIDCQPEEAGEDKDIDQLEPGAALLERLTEEVELVLSSGGTFELTKVILMVLEAMYRGVGLHRVIFALVSADHQSVGGRLGLGPDIDAFLESFQFRMSMRSGPVATTLLGKQDLYVIDDRFADSRFGQLVGGKHFGLLPVVVGEVAVGCFYLDWEPDSGRLPDEVRHLLSRLRSLAAEAVETSRARQQVSA